MPPGCRGARRPENRVTTRSKLPEQVHRAALSDEASAEAVEDAVDVDERPPEVSGGVWMVDAITLIFRERCCIGQLR